MFKARVSGITGRKNMEKSTKETEYTRVTRECPQCHRFFDPGNWRGPNGEEKRFCCTPHRWAWHNEQRLDAKNIIKSLIVALRITLKASQELLDMCVAEVRRKIAEGHPRDSLQSQEFFLADMATQIFAARQALYKAAQMRDQGVPVTHEASMVKLFCTEMASRIADIAMDIFGDAGYLRKNRIETLILTLEPFQTDGQ